MLYKMLIDILRIPLGFAWILVVGAVGMFMVAVVMCIVGKFNN